MSTQKKTTTKKNDTKTEQSKKINSIWYYIAGLAIIFVISFSYIFNEKIDLNGDNCDYYMLATSIAEGHGYSNISSSEYPPANNFPPGYPFLMSLIRFFTDSILVQKIYNGLFLLASSVLFFLFIRRNNLPTSLAFVASAAVLLNYYVLHFATMMMSEMSYLFMSVLALWALSKIDYSKRFWKDPFFYVVILSVAFGYYIRTQGVALFVAVLCFFLCTRKWKYSLGYVAGFIICQIPWMIRNKIQGFEGNRYLESVGMANAWRPEEGVLDFGGIVSRFFDTLSMLITKAVPSSIIPYFSVDYEVKSGLFDWVIALLLFAVIILGFIRFGKYKYFFIFYVIAMFGVICLHSAPSQNRYITTLLPFFEVGLFVGLYTILDFIVKRTKIAPSFSPWILAVLFILVSFPKLKDLHKINKAPFPPNYENFFKVAKTVHDNFPDTVMVCSRKPSMFYMYGRTRICNYKWTENDVELIQGLIDNKVDFVVLEQLGYSSTFRYLYPAIQKHQELFAPIYYLPNPDTYLLKFEREQAIQKLKK
ncbi:MAG: ArnT family glycosyltransferase [Dysgonomonas sp.]